MDNSSDEGRLLGAMYARIKLADANVEVMSIGKQLSFHNRQLFEAVKVLENTGLILPHLPWARVTESGLKEGKRLWTVNLKDARKKILVEIHHRTKGDIQKTVAIEDFVDTLGIPEDQRNAFFNRLTEDQLITRTRSLFGIYVRLRAEGKAIAETELKNAPPLDSAHGIKSTPVPRREGRIDLLIISALTEEAQVVTAALDYLATYVRTEDLVRIYDYDAGTDATFRIATASPHTVGAVRMGIFTDPLLKRWRPRSAALIGIAAAVDTSAVELGDVPISNQVLGYDDMAVQDGTLTFRSEGFQVDPAVIAGAGELRTAPKTYLPWQECCRSAIVEVVQVVNQLRRKPIVPPAIVESPHLVVGTTAGGPILLRDSEFRDSLRELPKHTAINVSSPLHPKLVSAEMESHGFMRVTHENLIPASVIKGIELNRCAVGTDRDTTAPV